VTALEFSSVTKSFGAVRALTGVSFSIASGEVHAIVGENGAGKSTLLKILAGVTRADTGGVTLFGEPFGHANPREALAAGIGTVFQERLAFPDLSVAANIFAARELTTRSGRLDHRAMRSRTRDLLARLRLKLSPDLLMGDVSAAGAQLVQVARALAFDCRVLVLDEPTTSLTDAEVDRLFAILADLKRSGVTVVFVSHRLPEVFRLCDRITVLRDGRHVGTFERRQTTPDDIVRAMVGRDPAERIDRPAVDPTALPRLSVRGLTREPHFRRISLEVRPGEIVGIFGLVGSGRSELLETLFGLVRPDAGVIVVEGAERRFRSARDASRAGLALVPEDRQRQGLHANLTIRHNMSLAAGAQRGWGRIAPGVEIESARALASTLALRARSLDDPPESLSGGNQQKVVVGKWLATNPRVLLLDEPTKGVDVGAKFELHNLIRARAVNGLACLVVSSDLPELLALADRILVMREGEIRGEVDAAWATEERVMRLATHEEAGAA
jgi:rhamnose transport system ATP-binding protein